ncbi:MAG TPA: CRISPR-associated protein Cas4, partial [Gemmatales bacterium]|nr:CRISPR-associated protein Cas4 [Gemmatales bacterium]
MVPTSLAPVADAHFAASSATSAAVPLAEPPTRVTLPQVAEPPGQGELIPARMLNEFTYCPRLGYLEWVQGEWADNPDTAQGEFVHRNVDQKDQRPVAADTVEEVVLHARSLRLENAELGLVAVVDVVELEGASATPVDYKKGRVPNVPEGAWEPERVQLCAQGLLLRAAGFTCQEGVIWYAASRRRVVIPFTEELITRTKSLAAEFRQVAAGGQIPPPLVDSPKCPRCSLVGICLPDETNFLAHKAAESSASPRLLLVPHEHARPLHVLEQGARVGKSGDRLVVERKDERLGDVPLAEVPQLCLFGNVQVSTQALAE